MRVGLVCVDDEELDRSILRAILARLVRNAASLYGFRYFNCQ